MTRGKSKNGDYGDRASSSLSPPPSPPSEPSHNDSPAPKPSHNDSPAPRPPHAWTQQLPPEWMTRGGFQATNKTNARGPLYRSQYPCDYCQASGKECLINALRGGQAGFFNSARCASCVGGARCSLSAARSEFGWQWDELAGKFVRVRLSQHILDRRAYFRKHARTRPKEVKQRLHGDGNSSAQDCNASGAQDSNWSANDSEASEDGEDGDDSDDDSPLVPAEHATEMASSERDSTPTVPGVEGLQPQPGNTLNESNRLTGTLHAQHDGEPAPPKYIPVIELLDSSDEEDEVVSWAAVSRIPKRPRSESAGPSNTKRSHHQATPLVQTIATAPLSHPTTNSPRASSMTAPMKPTYQKFREQDAIPPTPRYTDMSTSTPAQTPPLAATRALATSNHEMMLFPSAKNETELLEAQFRAMTEERDRALDRVKERDRTIEERDSIIEERDKMINHLMRQHSNLLKLYQDVVQMSSAQMGQGSNEL